MREYQYTPTIPACPQTNFVPPLDLLQVNLQACPFLDAVSSRFRQKLIEAGADLQTDARVIEHRQEQFVPGHKDLSVGRERARWAAGMLRLPLRAMGPRPLHEPPLNGREFTLRHQTLQRFECCTFLGVVDMKAMPRANLDPLWILEFFRPSRHPLV
jgi:hypothetical protein